MHALEQQQAKHLTPGKVELSVLPPPTPMCYVASSISNLTKLETGNGTLLCIHRYSSVI